MQHPELKSRTRFPVALTILCLIIGGCKDQSTSPLPTPGVTVTTPSASLSLTQGDRISVVVRLLRTGGYTGPIDVIASSPISSIAAQLSRSATVDGEGSLLITASPSTAPGTYPVILRASGNGIAAVSTTLDIRILARTASDISVAWCTALAPTWVAFQDGDGAWTRILPVVEGGVTYFQHRFQSARGAIATLDHLFDGAITRLGVFYGLPAELPSVGDTDRLDCAAVDSKTLFGTIAGLDTNEVAFVSSGVFGISSVRLARRSFALFGLPSGPQDLLATRTVATAGSEAILGIILRRGIDVADSSAVPTFDFASAEAFAPATASVAITGLGSDRAFASTRLRTSHSEMSSSLVNDHLDEATRPYYSIPEERLLPGDLQVLDVSTSGTGTVSRRVDQYFRAPADQHVSLGPPVTPPVISTVATTPSLRVRARFPLQAEYDRSTSILFEQSATPAQVQVTMSAAHAATNGAGYDLVLPDLSSVDGFDPAWTLRDGQQLTWSATRLGGSLALGRSVVPVPGDVRRTAFLQDTITSH